MTDTLTPRQIKTLTQFATTDICSAAIFNIINLVSYVYVSMQLIKNPQTHLATLCFFFGLASLADAIYFNLDLINGNPHPEALNILAATHNIFFCVGHWKFVFQFFVGAIDTKNILWNSTDWHIRQIILYKVPLDWVVTTLITLSFLACFFGG